MFTCPRCQRPSIAFTMSMFNTEDVCTACRDEERTAPGYAAAAAAEDQAMRAGNFNFKGVGLSPADAAYLAAKRATRS